MLQYFEWVKKCFPTNTAFVVLWSNVKKRKEKLPLTAITAKKKKKKKVIFVGAKDSVFMIAFPNRFDFTPF